MKLIKSIPALPVEEIAGATNFYRDRLGFSIAYADENFAIVTRDGLELHLWAASDKTWQRRTDVESASPVVSGAESFLAGTASCRIEVRGIESLYEELKETGVLYSSGTNIEETPWGTREFPVLDLERNLLTFYEQFRGRAEGVQRRTFYHGTRADLEPGDLIEPRDLPDVGGQAMRTAYVYVTPSLDAAIWAAELAAGEGPGRVYTVEPIGQVEHAPDRVDQQSPGHLSLSWRSRESVRVTGEITEWPLYHGTRADLEVGDRIKPGHSANFGKKGRTTTYVYLTRTLDAAIWAAELAVGEGPGRIYIVEPTGPIEDDPNLTDKKFRGNPTKSYRSREPLRVIGEILDWQGHAPDMVKAMKDGLALLERRGVEPID